MGLIDFDARLVIGGDDQGCFGRLGVVASHLGEAIAPMLDFVDAPLAFKEFQRAPDVAVCQMLDGGQQLGDCSADAQCGSSDAWSCLRFAVGRRCGRVDRLMLAGIAGQEDAVVMTNSN